MLDYLVRVATIDDLEQILALMRAYYAYDRLKFNEAAARNALQELLEDTRLGRIWLIQVEAEIAGYLVLCFGFSLEYHGRDAFIDEIYIREEFRGHGLGKGALKFVERVCGELGIKALHLEVEKENINAQMLYRKCGFVDHDRYLMTKCLENNT